MAPNPKIKKACDAMKPYGIPEAKVKSVLKNLLKTYANNWDFIQDENYEVLLNAILDEEPDSTDVATSSGKKKALRIVARDEEDDDDMDEDEVPLRKRLRSKRDNNNIVLSLCAPMSLEAKTVETKHTRSEDEDEDETPLRRRLRRKRENNNVLSLCGPMSLEAKTMKTTLARSEEEDEDGTPLRKWLPPKRDNNNVLNLCGPTSLEAKAVETKYTRLEEEDDITELPPLKRYLHRSNERGSNNATPISMELKEVVAETVKDSVARAIILLEDEPYTDHIHVICSSPKLEVENSEILVEGNDQKTECTLDEITALVVTEEKDAAATSFEIVSECDITVDEGSFKIPWMNEITDEAPQRFRYLNQSYVFRNADLKFSLSSFSDQQCCSSTEDCLVSATPCNCAITADNRFAYRPDGLLDEDFLEARISEARDQRKQMFHICKKCPLQKGENEPCKGHMKREAIKECWISCGCAKKCGNRLVQRGLHTKLQVFFTPNGKGWGLRTLEKLPQGAFVCEYIGEILTISELHRRNSENKVTYPVILDAFWCSKESVDDNKALCIDNARYGNVSRFLNHRCLDANLIEIPVLVETPEKHYYHIAFFTTRDIEAMEELTWDYGIDFDDDESLVKPFDCLCGSRFCRNKKWSKKAKKMKRA